MYAGCCWSVRAEESMSLRRRTNLRGTGEQVEDRGWIRVVLVQEKERCLALGDPRLLLLQDRPVRCKRRLLREVYVAFGNC